jgi:SAM-dependent methyltransferase
MRCPVCSSSSVRRKPFKYAFRGSELYAWGCIRCGVIFLHPQPTAQELKELYSQEYFEGGDFRCGHEQGYSDPATLEKIVDTDLLLQLKSMTSGRRFLEIGCAGGALLNAAEKEGFQTHGVELSEDASRFARERFGLHVFTGELVAAEFRGGSFDVVFMGDVIEHLPDPVASLSEINRILDKDGLLVMALPSQTNTLFSRIGFFVYDILGKSTTVAMPPYHLFEYQPRSLRFLLQKCGFTVVKLDQGIIPPGQINMRGSFVQQMGKKMLQYPNFILTRAAGVLGDRIMVFAQRDR